MFRCRCRPQDEGADGSTPQDEPTLKSFYAAEGEDLWRCRLGYSQPEAGGEALACHWMRKVDETPSSMLVTCADTFREMEASTSGGGGALVKRGKQGPVRTALTGVSGQTWVRQRQAITGSVLPLGLGHGRPEALAEAVASRLCAQLGSRFDAEGPFRLDAKDIFETSFAEWILMLVLGIDPREAGDLVQQFLGYWRRIRTKVSSPNRLERDPDADKQLYRRFEELARGARERCAAASPDSSGDGGCSLLEAMARNSLVGVREALTPDEIVPNLYSFLVAGFETTYSITLWTMIALADPAHSALAARVRRECAMLGASPEALAAQRQVLVELKQAATASAPLPEAACCTGGKEGMLLVRTIAETCRVFPPVWGLPRALTKEYDATASTPRIPEGSWLSGDVLCMNGESRDAVAAWNPVQPWPCPARDARLATWGVGARACPAGTGALLAAWTVLRRVLAEFTFEEMSVAKVVSEAYLGVTLCSEGPVQALVRRGSEESRPRCLSELGRPDTL